MILTQRARAAIAALCLISLTPSLAWAGKYGSFRTSSPPSVSVRTPSVTSPVPRVTAPASPAPTSGGYGSFRSQERTPSVNAAPRPALTGSDRVISRETSGSALSDMRRQDTIARQPRPTPTAPSGTASSQGGVFSNPNWTRPRVTERTPPAAPPQWQRQPDWNVPSYAQPRQSYGDWNPFLMWYLIASLNRPGSSEFFHNHRDDPGYRQWRAEAEQQAKSNADLRAKLDELDKKLDEKKNDPVDAKYVPAGIDPKIAHATQPVSSGGSGWLIAFFLILLLGAVGTLAWLEWNKRRRRTRTGLEPMTNTDTLINLVKTKVTGPDETPLSRFKVGQVITIERTPFLMASASKIVRPETRDGTTSIVRLGKLSGSGNLSRLYLDDVNFLQVSEAPDGTIADCRYFSRIDEQYPQNSDEWRVWLDPRSGWSDLDLGILADPKFLTPDDNALYDRVWTPGDNRVPPREMRETLNDLDGSREIAITAQLYARAMPEAEDRREYLLVEVREEGPQASVILYAGIDLPASSLGL